MLEMGFVSFLTLTIVGAVVAVVYHWALQDRFFERLDLVFGKLLLGWIGAWLGSPVLGHWLWKYNGIYLVPALLGAIAAVHLAVLAVKTFAPIAATKSAVADEAQRAKAAAAS
jgi:uncharacterized membrane protein YeaQ/YmgE (transglycosylase-associated protein family)